MMKLAGNFKTTAMGILPHTQIEPAIKLALELDIPFWPQLPRLNFYEDMYVQVTENFPGMLVDEAAQKVRFSLDKFYAGLADYAVASAEPGFFGLSEKYSAVFHQFLEQDLSQYYAIRGQNIGPISFGMKMFDSDRKPIAYNDEVREFLLDFLAQKVNAQHAELVKKNPRAFVWIDEPGMEIIFGAFSGYSSDKARQDMIQFFEQVQGLAGIHLCGNPDWSFLLSGVPIDILSLDILSNGEIFARYSGEIKEFLNRGGIISWGVVPTFTEVFDLTTAAGLVNQLEETWKYLIDKGISKDLLIDRSWLAPARCCLINADGDQTVAKSFTMLKEVAQILKEKYNVQD